MREREREPMVLPSLWLLSWPPRLLGFIRADGFGLFGFTRAIEVRGSRHRRRGSLEPLMALPPPPGMKGLGS